MLIKITLSILGFSLWLFAIPTIYPIEPAAQARGNVIEATENTAIPKCAVHPMGEEYDLNLNGSVDITDIMKVANAWNLKLHDKNYSPAYDFNNDNKVSIQDIMVIANKWGKGCYELYPKKEEK